MVRLGTLFGGLGWHAVVGFACLARGRRGFEALQVEPLAVAVVIMLGASVVVMTELVFRHPGATAPSGGPVGRLITGLGLVFAAVTALTWAWVFWGSRGYGYDRLAAVFSSGWGASFDAESGAGFAGIPWLALPFAAGLGAYTWSTVSYAEQRWTARSSGEAAPFVSKLMLVVGVILAALAFGGVLHLSNGVLLGA